MQKFLLFLLLSFSAFTLQAQSGITDPIKIGKHNLTLQWISWDKPGKINIGAPDPDGWREVEGAQIGEGENQGAYLKVNGRLKQLSQAELIFEGTIETLVSHLSDGKPCVRDGTYHFKATGKRKYWRLQEMKECGEKGATDYVDIYFF